jgi:tripartite-type tricarboxylate transporter receptor subunit TctC
MLMNKFTRRIWLKRVIGASAVMASHATSIAQTKYPGKTIRVIVPYAPGGGTDVIGRKLLQNMAIQLGQPIIIDNRPGAGTVIGTDAVARAEPDGYTLLINTNAIAVNASLVKKLPYNTLQDLVPVGRICTGPNVIVVRADSPFKSLSDIIQASKAKPGSLSYASSGNGTAVHLAAELLKVTAKIRILHIPYRGAGPAYTDLLGGQVDMLFGTAGGVSKFIQSGRMRAIAVTSETRSPAYPDVPAVAETLPGYSANVWYGMFAPKGTPNAILNALNDSMRLAVNDPSYNADLVRDGLTAAVNSPSEMMAFMRSEVDRWQKVVTEAGITLD